MTERQWIWGLSNGVSVLALSGFAWASLGLGVGFPPVAARSGIASLFPWLAIGNLLAFALLLFAGFRLRGKAEGFRRSDLSRDDPETRRISVGLRWVILVETVLISLTAFLCARFQRGDMAWSWIALVLGVHFLPLAALFRLHLYYVTGVASTIVALVAIVLLDEPPRMLFLGYGMGLTAWASCVYLVQNAVRIAREADAPSVLVRSLR